MKIFSLVVVCIFAIGASPTKAQTEKLTTAQRSKFVAEAKEFITNNLLDPAAVQFRKLSVSTAVAPVLCGEINTKNSMGGYIGFTPFYALRIDGKVSGRIYVDGDEFFPVVFKSYCSGGGTPVK